MAGPVMVVTITCSVHRGNMRRILLWPTSFTVLILYQDTSNMRRLRRSRIDIRCVVLCWMIHPGWNNSCVLSRLSRLWQYSLCAVQCRMRQCVSSVDNMSVLQHGVRSSVHHQAPSLLQRYYYDCDHAAAAFLSLLLPALCIMYHVFWSRVWEPVWPQDVSWHYYLGCHTGGHADNNQQLTQLFTAPISVWFVFIYIK